MTEQPAPAFVPSPEFLARQKRMDDAANLRKPDRVPIAPLVVHFYPTRSAGIKNKDAMYDVAMMYEYWKQAAIKHNWDVATPVGPVFAAQPMELLGATQFRWPGQSLADDMPFQWVEGEYMLQDEYDEMLADPNGFAITKLWPRIGTLPRAASAFVQQLTHLPWLANSNAYMLPGLLSGAFGAPPARELLEKLLALLKESAKARQAGIDYSMGMAALGFPTVFSAITLTAFDWISDNLRGMRGAMLDMYRVPDKLLATIEMLTPISIQTAVMLAELSGIRGVFIPLHRGAGGFMSNEQFAKFYWPSLKALILGLIESDLLPIPLFEGDYTPRLEFLQELPPKKWLGHFDIVDRKKAKELLGDLTCFWGNVPAGLMCTGTPEQVTADVRDLIEIFGDNGGLIIDSTMGIPDESRPENVQALTDAVVKYGVY